MRKNLKEARKKLGLSQKEIAKQVGICQQYYSFIEQGTRKGNYNIWDRLEDITGVHQRVLREIS